MSSTARGADGPIVPLECPQFVACSGALQVPRMGGHSRLPADAAPCPDGVPGKAAAAGALRFAMNSRKRMRGRVLRHAVEFAAADVV